MVQRRQALALVTGIAAALALAACSSGSSGSSGSNTSASKPLTNLTVAYAATGAGYSDLYVGVSDGIFKKYGLNVKLVLVTPTNLVPGLLSGSAQIGAGVADGTASAILKGEGMRFVALTEGTYNLQLWATKGITSVHQLIGKTVALTTEGSETDFALTALLQKDGINPSSVTRKYLVTTPQMLSAMHSGAVAAGLFQPPTGQQTGGTMIADLSDLPYAVGAYITASSYLNGHSAVVSKFLAAEKANLTYIRSHPAQTEAAIIKYNPGTTQAQAKTAYKFFLHVWKKNPTVTPSLIRAAFMRAAAKAHTTAPANINQYIFVPKASG